MAGPEAASADREGALVVRAVLVAPVVLVVRADVAVGLEVVPMVPCSVR